MTLPRKEPTRWAWLVLICLAGAFARWHRLGDMRLLWDHAYPVAQAIGLAEVGEWPQLGQPTTFFFSNPPLQAYLSLVPWLVFGSFWLVIWAMTSLNVLAVPLLYSLLRRCLPEIVARLSAFLFAVSPWVVQFSRGTWSSALLPIGTVLALGLTLWSVSHRPLRRRQGFLFAALATLSVVGSTYLLALITMPIQVGALLATRWKRIPWRGAALGVAVLASVGLMYGLALSRDWPAQSVGFERLLRGERDGAALRPDALRLAVSYVTGASFIVSQIGGVSLPGSLGAAERAINGVLGLALAAGLLRAAAKVLRRDADAWVSAALVLWWFMPIALLSYNALPLHPWHLRHSLPAGHILASLGLAWPLQAWPRLRPAYWIGAVGQTGVALALLQVVAQHNAIRPVIDPLDQLTLSASVQVGEQLAALVDAHDLQAVYAPLPAVSPTAWSGRWLNAVQWFRVPDRLIVPTGQPALYVRSAQREVPEPLPLGERVALDRWLGEAYIAYDLVPPVSVLTARALPQNRLTWPSETGLTLLGYSLDPALQAGGPSRLTTYWLVEELAANRADYLYGPYLHLTNAEGAVIANVAGSALEGYYYVLGDLYIQEMQIVVPAQAAAGQYTLELGLYDGVHSVGTTFFPPGDEPRPYFSTVVEVK